MCRQGDGRLWKKTVGQQLLQRDAYLLEKYNNKLSQLRANNKFVSINLLVANNNFQSKPCAELMASFIEDTYLTTIDFSHSGWHEGSKPMLKKAAKKNERLKLILSSKEALGR